MTRCFFQPRKNVFTHTLSQGKGREGGESREDSLPFKESFLFQGELCIYFCMTHSGGSKHFQPSDSSREQPGEPCPGRRRSPLRRPEQRFKSAAEEGYGNKKRINKSGKRRFSGSAEATRGFSPPGGYYRAKKHKGAGTARPAAHLHCCHPQHAQTHLSGWRDGGGPQRGAPPRHPHPPRRSAPHLRAPRTAPPSPAASGPAAAAGGGAAAGRRSTPSSPSAPAALPPLLAPPAPESQREGGGVENEKKNRCPAAAAPEVPLLLRWGRSEGRYRSPQAVIQRREDPVSKGTRRRA